MLFFCEVSPACRQRVSLRLTGDIVPEGTVVVRLRCVWKGYAGLEAKRRCGYYDVEGVFRVEVFRGTK